MSKVEYLVVDTTAFIENTQLQNTGKNIITVQDVVNEITNKRQLRRLVVLPYDLKIKEVFPENIQFVLNFAKKTGDYQSLSATDIKVIALTYQLEKEHVGIEHLKIEPAGSKKLDLYVSKTTDQPRDKVVGFYNEENEKNDEEFDEQIEECLGEENNAIENLDDILTPVEDENSENSSTESEDDEESGWITPNNVESVKKEIGSDNLEEKSVTVACMTTDFAMQNVIKQIGLNVASLDGRVIKQLRTFIFRCYACFKTTSIMTKVFCPNCGNKTLKKVAVSLDENGKQVIHINLKKPLTPRGKKYSLPTFKGGKYAMNPILFEDQPMPQQRESKLAKTKNNPLDPDYTAGYSPFVMRDINSKSAMLGIRPGKEVKYWMKKNPNECHRRKKK